MMSGISAASGPMFAMRPDPQEMFNRVDKDGSGGIDADELSAMTEKMAEHTGETIDVDSLMETYDSDGDGVLNEEETHEAMESLREEMGPPPGGGRPPMGGPIADASGPMPGMGPSPEEMFNKVDEDGSGGVDADELSTMAEEMAERTGETIDVDSLMEAYDSDADGALNEEEMLSAMESLREEMGPPPADGPPMGGPMANGGMGFMDGHGFYANESNGGQSLIDQMIAALPESTDDEDTVEVLQQWLQTLKGENPSYSPLDTLV